MWNACSWLAHFSVSLKRSMMNGKWVCISIIKCISEESSVVRDIRILCKNISVKKYREHKKKNAAGSLWDTRSELMRRHALFPPIMRHTSFGSLHNFPTLWPSFKIFPRASIFHCIRNKYWTEFSYKVSVKFEDKEWIKRAITNTWRQVN